MEPCRNQSILTARLLVTADRREILPRLADCLEYPTPRLLDNADQTASLLAQIEPAAGQWLRRFVDSIRNQPVERLEELFTRTFLVTSQCIPYLSVHLFGEESFKRAELMAGLLETYRRHRFETDSELPDHLALVLHFAPHFSPEEWRDLRRYCLCLPLAKMIESLQRLENPYLYVFRAVQVLLEETPEVEIDA